VAQRKEGVLMVQEDNSTNVLNSQPEHINQLPQEQRNALHELNQLARQHNPHGWYLEWDDNRLVYVEEMTKSLLSAIASGLLTPAIRAMMSASGLTKDQAKTCVYYAIMTFLQEVYPELIPILLLVVIQEQVRARLKSRWIS